MKPEYPAYDVIVVGARCAGATLAALLARSGARVLLLDKSPLPSEHVLSSHTLHAAGMRVCARLGVAEQVRAVTPPMTALRLEKCGEALTIPLTPEQFEYCPRRARFDGLLQDAARSAGAEVVARARVNDVIWRANRAVGVRIAAPDGTERSVEASWIVGADGAHSRIAEAVGAARYHAYEAPRGSYWGYFPALPVAQRTMQIRYAGDRVQFVFHTDDDTVLVGVAPETRQLARFRADPLAALRADLADDPLASACAAREPREPLRGFTRAQYFFRRATGPGWALIGDAGVHREFITGDGMSEAMLQAESLAAAIGQGHDAALEAFWRARDRAVLPRYYFSKSQGSAGERGVLEAAMLRHARRHPALAARIAATLAYDLPPQAVLSPARALLIAVGAACRGAPRALSEFWEAGASARALAEALTRDPPTSERDAP